MQGNRLLIVTFMLLVARPAAAQIQFRASALTPLDQEPSAIIAADLNGDGNVDAITGHAVDQSVTVLLGDGLGNLSPSQDIFIGGPSRSLLLHDLDEDTIPDLLVSEEESNNLWFLHGFGDATFADPQLILVGHDPVDVAAADLDGDGHMDLAVALADEAGGAVGFLRGVGDGTFETSHTISLVSVAAQAVVIDDFDGNGVPDVAVSNAEPGSVSILIGQGNLAYADPVQILTGASTGPLESGDVNEDGTPDLMAGDTASDDIVVLIGRGNGTFDPPTKFATGGNVLRNLQVVDVNGDGHLDVVTANLRSQSASVLLGAGDGTFGSPRGFIADVGPVDLAVVDVNGDDHPDVITANQGVGGLQPTLAFLYGDGSGAFTGIEQLASVGATTGAAVADFDSDALPDAAMLVSGHAGITVRFGASSTPRRPDITVPLDDTSTAIATADLDGDDHADVLTANSSASLSVLFGTGQGSFDPALGVPLGAAATNVAIGDCDADGDPDVVITESSPRIQVSVVRNNGNRTFATLAPTVIDGRTAGLVLTDLTGDGILDVAVGDADGSRVVLLQGQGNCTFQQLPSVSLNTVPVRLAAVKLTEDGAVDDLAVIGAGQSNLLTLTNDGSGHFTVGPPRSGASFPLSITVRDLNGDSTSELLIGDKSGNLVTIIRNYGQGNLQVDQELLSSVGPNNVVTGDFDGDGRYDVLSLGATTCQITNVTDFDVPPRGDGNGDARLSVADITALISELYDGDGDRIDDVARGTFSASQGVDADGDGRVTRLDLQAMIGRLTGRIAP